MPLECSLMNRTVYLQIELCDLSYNDVKAQRKRCSCYGRIC